MSIFSGLGRRPGGLFSDIKGPWGSKGSGDDEPSGGPTGPWGEQPKRRRPGGGDGNNVSSLDDFLRKSRDRWSTGGGGGGGGTGRFSGRPNGSMIAWGVAALVVVWLIFTSFHSIAPAERGVVTRLGRYVKTLGPGVGLTLPSPFERVEKVDVESIRPVDLGSPTTEDLMLTGDQNVIDIAYSARWSIRDPEAYLFQLENPEETIRQVAESAMRSVISSVTLDDAIGDGRSEIETRVAETMQRILDGYNAGVTIRGVAVREADPPQSVIDAFKDVSAAQQDAQRYVNAANAYSQQLRQKAQGEATAFDRIYEQYRLAPEVTRRRMYYETMEKVLSNVDKTIVEAPGVTTYLPLPEVKKRADAQAQGAGQ
ncbi:FtsH protease activity modulator HflK [Sphingomonas sabuli]|uniref:Protein HflK n=1 Tax=Sphingomonas sabuli TaxID=2764186 RepID=A0A7G9L1H6_9SPHN|nr:FtsH protease activity modulator HflK [Sphingomonas sabuli]QNM82475.1 FtsH protease activity modulator HflK [Sphingomonas sabuli]